MLSLSALDCLLFDSFPSFKDFLFYSKVHICGGQISQVNKVNP